MSIYDKHIKATKLNQNKPHIFFHKGHWRINERPVADYHKEVQQQSLWLQAHRFISSRNAAFIIMRRG